jgi:predicted dehydrogenase
MGMSDRSLRWGILSSANINRKVVPGMRRADRSEVVAIASRDRERASRAAAELDIPRAHGSYEELLSDPAVDAIYNPLPNHLHAEWTIAAARAGKHVLCEKPLAMSAAEAERMIEACASAGVVLMEAFMYRLHPSWEGVRELVRSGRIGELRSVQSWFSYFNDDPKNIRNIAEAGGGALYDIGCYTVNLSRMLFEDEPSRIHASMTIDEAMGVDVLTAAILEFDRGVASFTVSTRAEPDQRVHVVGTSGRISVGIPFNIPPDRPTEVFLTSGGDPPVHPNSETITFDAADPYAVQAERFADAVLDGAPPAIAVEDSLGNMRAIDEIFRLGRA